MPKRKRSKKYEDDLDHLMHQVRKLQRKIRDRSESVSSRSGSSHKDFNLQDPASPPLRPDDWFPEYVNDEQDYELCNPDITNQQINIEGQLNPAQDSHSPAQNGHNPDEDQCDQNGDRRVPDKDPNNTSQSQDHSRSVQTNQQPSGSSIDSSRNLPNVNPSTSTAIPIDTNETKNDKIELDDDVLLILGDDPSSSLKYGKDIRKEIATRFTHIVTEGTTKEIRKDLVAKYPIPANCVHIGAPKLNPEIRAAVSENFVKRDKGIESKQKEMASALACLGEVITSQLNAKDKNNDLLQKLIDLSRILCDVQHADSVTRRNFILFNLKKDLKDHLVNTKIDTFLFGENLSETLKTAKAVNKSGVELKAAAPKQAPATRLKSVVSRPLNRRAPAPRRPALGQQPAPAPAPRGRAPALRAPAPPPPARYSRTSYAHQPPQRRY